jgi:hypothetical protein
LSRSASVQLTAPTTGTYAGIVLFQSRDNTQTISISGPAVATFAGTVYARAATVSVTGSAKFVQEALVANELQLQGGAMTTGTTAGLAVAQGLSSSGNAPSTSSAINAPAATLTENEAAQLSGASVVADLTVNGNGVVDAVDGALGALQATSPQEMLIGDLAFDQLSSTKPKL